MSIDNVKGFVAKLVGDHELKSKVDWSNVDSIISTARTAGFEFSAEDLANAPPPESFLEELGDADLDNVAGGGQFLWSLAKCKDRDPPPTDDGPVDDGRDKDPKEISTSLVTCPGSPNSLSFCGTKFSRQ